ncbi:site-specific integrase [Nisaea denitrificans]|uniref:site-specific integrase n=1 Tax=Nisaea denitrificans TaxID=390877 RepID=UPI0003FA76DE
MIKRQGSIYHFRRMVPERIRSVVGRREIWCSLRTANRSVARARAARLYLMTEDIFDPDTCLDPARWELEIAKLSAEVASLELEKFKRKTELDETRRLMREAYEVKAQGELLQAATAKLQSIKDGTIEQGAALTEARKARDAVLAALSSAAAGKATAEALAPSPLFSELVEDYLADRQRTHDGHRGYSPKTVKHTRGTFGLWAGLIGNGPVREIKGEDAGRFREFLLRLPASHGKSRSNILEPLEAIDRADQADRPVTRLSMKTAKRHFSAMAQYWKWLEPRGHVDKNIFAGFNFPGTKGGKKKRDDWSSEDLKLFFGSEWYLGREPNSSERWFPLIGLYSGMRLEEIARLRPSHDVVQVAGIWCFKIQEHLEPDPWSPKSEAGARIVPIHSRLIALGLVDLVEQRKNLPYLWPDLKPPGSNESFSEAFSREFSRRKKAIGVGEKTVFHSFRHTARTVLESSDLQERWIDAAFGHENGSRSVGGKVYAKRVDVERLQEVIEVIKVDI